MFSSPKAKNIMLCFSVSMAKDPWSWSTVECLIAAVSPFCCVVSLQAAASPSLLLLGSLLGAPPRSVLLCILCEVRASLDLLLCGEYRLRPSFLLWAESRGCGPLFSGVLRASSLRPTSVCCGEPVECCPSLLLLRKTYRVYPQSFCIVPCEF
jgi:hypothetical protein